MVSVIVPVYNVEKYLNRCLNSLFCQTLKDIEFILVDDGSKDNCPIILDDFCKDKTNFKVFHKENGGLLSAWKYGVCKAKGEYIGFVDSDDYIAPDMYSILYDKACKYNVDIAMCNHYYVNTNGIETLHINPIEEGLYVNNDFDKIRELFIPVLNKNYISPSRCPKIVKKEIILKTLNELNDSVTSAEDTYSTLQWMMYSNSFYYVEKVLYYYCKNENSISHVYKANIFETYGIIIRALDFLNKRMKKVSEIKIKNLYNFYGFLWCLYVSKSNLTQKEKKKEILRMTYTKEYRQALKFQEKGHFIRKILYRLTVKFNFPFFILTGIKFMEKRNG